MRSLNKQSQSRAEQSTSYASSENELAQTQHEMEQYRLSMLCCRDLCHKEFEAERKQAKGGENALRTHVLVSYIK